MSGIAGWVGVAEHGTRAKYVRDRCRCDACRAANATRYRERNRAMRAAAGEVKATGPAGSGIQLRAGKEYRIKTCPGANGTACVRGGAWLKNGTPVCTSCVERHTVFAGLIDAGPTRAHLMRLRHAGVGYKTVSAASDVGCSVLSEILAGTKKRLRASTARRILAVDESAIADHAVVSGAKTREAIRRLLRMGYTRGRIAQEALGNSTRALQIRKRVLAITALKIEKFLRRAELEHKVRRRCPNCHQNHEDDDYAFEYCLGVITRGEQAAA